MGKPQNRPKSLVQKKKDSGAQGRNRHSKEAAQAIKQKLTKRKRGNNINRVTTSDEQLVSQEQSNIMQEVSVDKQHENDDEACVIGSETEEVDEAPDADDETTTFINGRNVT